MNTIKKYFRLSWIIFFARFTKQLRHPADTFFRSCGTMCFVFLNIAMTYILLDNYKFPGWSRNEFLIFMYSFIFFYYGAFTLYWQGLKLTAFEINHGIFDFILMKPVNARFLSFFRAPTINNIVSVVFGLLMLLVSLYQYNFHYGFLMLPVYFLFVAISLWMFHCFSMILLTMNFKYPGLEHLRAVGFAVQEVYKYPSSSYSGSMLGVKLLVLPFSLLSTIPATMILLKRVDLLYLAIYFLIAIGLTIISKQIWSWGLRNYTSAS